MISNVTYVVRIASKFTKLGKILTVIVVCNKVCWVYVQYDLIDSGSIMRNRVGIEPNNQVLCNLLVSESLTKCLCNRILVRDKEQLTKQNTPFLAFKIKLAKLFVAVELVGQPQPVEIAIN